MNDCRIQFPPTAVNFNNVGSTGQPHDDYPSAGQARFDWMRMTLIGLLAHQSSIDPPTNYRQGTIWYCLADEYFKYFKNDTEGFVDLSHAIRITIGDRHMSLNEWANYIENAVLDTGGMAVWSGTASGATYNMQVPSSAATVAQRSNSYPILYKNGEMIDPKLTSFNGARTIISLRGDAVLNYGDDYIMTIQRVDLVV